MSVRPPYDSPVRAEQLFRTAEIRAACANPDKEMSQLASPDSINNRQLASLAACELERCAVRNRYLPAELVCDAGWNILLDILVCEFHSQPIYLAGSASRWKISETTAARQIAGLIEVGMVKRVFGQNLGETAFLRLTDYGRAVLQRTLTLLD